MLASNLLISSCHNVDVFQGILPHNGDLTAVGRIVDAALSRIFEDIIKLPVDESHRLSELCRMLNVLEAIH